ncbi:hypothetical protein EPD60_06610 [Flaviaesturariibacter flavus]|uniref:Nuclear transport factor 2 family protein n=1 Tax=Flaviaesturariibacter flavus TaxID=2502780 RepID=A0A4R1BKE8_9BACT|nr:hypothetical protein [Flaviaesturariibacter flavus]TCJ17851.1 hypothetical protein EPD60_06610 [Flaviaesturariibacter flavus]
MLLVKKLLLAFALLLCIGASAQNHATTIKVQAMDMGRNFMKNDFNGFVKYMHPNIIGFAGGQEKMKTRMDSAYTMMQRFGVSFKKYLIGTPSAIVSYKNQLQSVLPVSTVMKTPMGDLSVETAMIVISNDGGKSWWFIDTNVYRADKLKSILPDLSPDIVLPARSKPKLVQPANAN